MFRERRRERREERGAGGTHYQMRQRLVSIGDDFWIQNDRGERVFKVDGKALRLRSTLVFEDAQGHELAKIQERMLRVRDTMEIEGPDGQTVASIKKAVIAPLRDRWTVKMRNGPDLSVQGNILDHEYSIGEGRETVAEVSKRWFRMADTYGVEIAPGQDEVLVLAVTTAIDMMAHESR
ncbi:MAG TPA: LURP-one-related family protein [Candidatus Dormibacteraeota bacterium]|nr:LURP-one-related family protein [Candidatus Dormibacteraeota bacterium]